MSQPPPPSGGTPPSGPPPGGQPPGGPPPGGPYGGYPPAGGAPGGQPPAPLSPSEETTWAGAAHWSSLVASLVGLSFLGPLVVLLVQGQRSGFVRRHAVESLNFQLSVLIYSLALSVLGTIFGLVTLGLGFLVLVPVMLGIIVVVIVLVILASMAASRREDYRYPLTLRMVS